MNNLKFYMFCDCDIVVSNLNLDDTVAWYQQLMDIDESDVIEIDADKFNIEIDEDTKEMATLREFTKDFNFDELPTIIASSEY